MRNAILNGPVASTLHQLTRPMIIGILAMMFFSLVDAWFVSLLGTTSLAAVSFAQPVTMVVSNMAIGLGIALSALIARAVGADDAASLRRALTSGLALSFALGALLWLAGVVSHDAIFKAMGADAELLPEIWAYMMYWWPGSVLLLALMMQNASLRAMGNTKLPSLMMLGASIMNAALDPLLIFGLGPIPAMGIGGASLASGICWAIVLGVIMRQQIRHGYVSFVELTMTQMLALWKRLLALGIPAMITNLLVPVAGAILLSMIAHSGEAAVAGFGVGMRFDSFLLCLVLALTATLPAFVAQNHAVGNDDRIWLVMNYSLRLVVIAQLSICAVLWLMAEPLAQLFSDDANVVQVTVMYLHWLPLGYVGMGIVLCVNAALNSLQKTVISMVLNTVRLFAFYVLGAVIGLQLDGVRGLLIGAAAGNLLAGGIVWWLMHRMQSRGELSMGSFQLSLDRISRH